MARTPFVAGYQAKLQRVLPIEKAMNSQMTQYTYVLKGPGVNRTFHTDDETAARKRIVDFVGSDKDCEGFLYTRGEPGSTWYDHQGWHYD